MSILGIGLGLASTASGIYNSIRSAKAPKKQHKRQKELQEHAKEQQLDIWNKTNYEAQRKHIENAGLNPGLLYGMGGTGGATTGSVGAGTAAQENVYDLSNAINQAQAVKANIELTKAQAEKTKAEAEKIKGVDTEEAENRVAKLAAETSNEKIKNGLLEAETNIKEIQASLDARTFNARFDQLYWSANKAYEEWQQATTKTYIDKETRDEVITIIEQNAIGAAIENIAKETGIEVDKMKIKQMAETIAQGWEGLKQGEEKIATDKFKATINATYPSVMNTIGRAAEDTMDALFNLFNKQRKTWRGIK